MNCQDFLARLHPYVDGELAVEEMAATGQHGAECRNCDRRLRGEQAFRELLRRQPQEAASTEFRVRIAARLRNERRRRLMRPWLIGAAAAGALAAIVVLFVRFGMSPTTSLVDELVDKHNVYAQINQPAELATADRPTIERWFVERADLRVAVPDLTTLSQRNGGKYPYDRVVRIIESGESVRGHGTPVMPAWGDAFKRTKGTGEATAAAAIRNLGQYLWTLQPPAK